MVSAESKWEYNTGARGAAGSANAPELIPFADDEVDKKVKEVEDKDVNLDLQPSPSAGTLTRNSNSILEARPSRNSATGSTGRTSAVESPGGYNRGSAGLVAVNGAVVNPRFLQPSDPDLLNTPSKNADKDADEVAASMTDVKIVVTDTDNDNNDVTPGVAVTKQVSTMSATSTVSKQPAPSPLEKNFDYFSFDHTLSLNASGLSSLSVPALPPASDVSSASLLSSNMVDSFVPKADRIVRAVKR